MLKILILVILAAFGIILHGNHYNGIFASIGAMEVDFSADWQQQQHLEYQNERQQQPEIRSPGLGDSLMKNSRRQNHQPIKTESITSQPDHKKSCFFAWGRNQDNELAIDSEFSHQSHEHALDSHLDVPTPFAYGTLHNHSVIHISAGYYHSVVVDSKYRAYSWGANRAAESGLGSVTTVGGRGEIPYAMPIVAREAFNKKKIKKVFAAWERTYMQDVDSHVYYIGRNDLNAISAKIYTSPTELLFSEGGGIQDMSLGVEHFLILSKDGRVFCYGRNGVHHRCGTGMPQSEEYLYTPTPVANSTSNSSYIEKQITSISAGYFHNIVLSSDGVAFTWGANSNGQLCASKSPQTLAASSVPVEVYSKGVLNGIFVSQIAAGQDHNILLDAGGHLYCCGKNANGRCGNGNTIDQDTPQKVQVDANIRFIHISSGGGHNLALTDDGIVYSWGRGKESQLGSNSTQDRYTPSPIVLPHGLVSKQTRFKMISAGFLHSLILSKDGIVYSFGNNANNECGVDMKITGSVSVPHPIFELSDLFQHHPQHFNGEDHILTVTSAGEIVASGDNAFAQLSDGSTVTRKGYFHSIYYPQSSTKFYQTATGIKHTLALSEYGRVLVWGGDEDGQLGLEMTTSLQPTPIVLESSPEMNNAIIIQVTAGPNWSMALSSKGEVFAWGKNTDGCLCLDDDKVTRQVSPALVREAAKEKKVIQISSGERHSLFLTEEGQVEGCGSSKAGQLPRRAGADEYKTHVPVSLSQLSPLLKNRKIIQVSAGDEHSLFLSDDGEVFGCGSNQWGQLGLGESIQNAFSIVSITRSVASSKTLEGVQIIEIAAGARHSLLLSSNENSLGGTVFECGGIRNITSKRNLFAVTPVDMIHVPEPEEGVARRIFAGKHHSFLIQCPRVECFGKHQFHPLACSGAQRGQCTGPNKCECSEHYAGEECSLSVCHDYSASDERVCSGHGMCAQPDTCLCDPNYEGARCEMWSCGNIPANAIGAVCSGHGSCVAHDVCECDSRWWGSTCSTDLLWFILPPAAALVVIAIIGLGVLSVCAMYLFKKVGRVNQEKQATQRLLNGFIQDTEMDQMDSDSQRARLIVQSSRLEINFSELMHLEKIASGGSGAIVFRGEWNGTKVAVKVFKGGLMTGETWFHDFENEVSLMSTLRHRNIVDFYGCSLAYPRIAIVMELCETGSVESMILSGALKRKSSHEVLQMLLDIAEGMQYLHSRGVLHRDLKAANVLLDDHHVVKITDFGLSKYTKDKIAESHTTGIGTLYYCSPELAQGRVGDYGEGVDVYSFGILATEMLLCRLRPFAREYDSLSDIQIQYRASSDGNFRPDLRELNEGNFGFLKWVLESCWQEDPSRRPPFRDIVKILKSSLYDVEG